MTKEEAIMVLKNEQPHCGKKALFPEEKKYEAYDVAIKALEQEPYEDCISRQAAIEALAEWHDVAITNRLNNLPPAQPSVSKTETVEDCISRQAAIDALENTKEVAK